MQVQAQAEQFSKLTRNCLKIKQRVANVAQCESLGFDRQCHQRPSKKSQVALSTMRNTISATKNNQQKKDPGLTVHPCLPAKTHRRDSVEVFDAAVSGLERQRKSEHAGLA